MAEPASLELSPAAEGSPCPACGLVLGPSLLACSRCGGLVHADRLRALAASAERASSEGRVEEASVAWRAALELLPPETRQHAAIVAKLELLGRSSSLVPPKTSSWHVPKGLGSGLAAAGALGLFLWKFKALAAILLTKGKFLLLGLTKLPTLLSMFVYFGTSLTLWGWPFALGLVLSIYVHEMGHVASLRRLGIAASAPMFIPGLGALVRLHQYPATPAEDARVGLAGPVWGLGAALACLGLFHATGLGVLGAIAKTGAWINLFNLVPVWSLDGARGFRALDGRQRWLVAGLFGGLFFVTGEVLLLAIAGVGAWRAWSGNRPPKGDSRALWTFAILAVALTAVAAMPGPGAG